MADKSKIEWTDASWNPLRGCTRVSEGCRNCYAERMSARFSKPGEPFHGVAEMTPQGPRWTGKVLPVYEHLADPLRWKKPRRIFVCSMSDLFHKDVPDEFVDKVFAVMALAGQHTYQVLTKRPERAAEYLRDAKPFNRIGQAARELWQGMGRQVNWVWQGGWPLSNVWVGTSVENQEAADKRIPYLLQVPAAVRFLSVEPMLGPVNLRPGHVHSGFPGHISSDGRTVGARLNIHWVICGGENGRKVSMPELDGRVWDQMPVTPERSTTP